MDEVIIDPCVDIAKENKKFGWALTAASHIKIPNPRTKINYAGKRGAIYFVEDWSLPPGWDYAHRKTADDFDVYESVPRPVYKGHHVEGLLTGKIGTITHYNIISDGFLEIAPRKSKYVYALTKGKDNKGHHIVQAYLWERDNPGKTYWYKFRSARLAHVHLKKYDAAKRTGKDS